MTLHYHLEKLCIPSYKNNSGLDLINSLKEFFNIFYFTRGPLGLPLVACQLATSSLCVELLEPETRKELSQGVKQVKRQEIVCELCLEN